MLRAGANIYYLAKMAVPRGVSVQDAGARFQGITTPEFQAKLLAKGCRSEGASGAAGELLNG